MPVGVDCDGWRWALRFQAAASAAICIVASTMSARPKTAGPTVHLLRRLTMKLRRKDAEPTDGPTSNNVLVQPPHGDVKTRRISTWTLLNTPCARIMAVYWLAAGFGYVNSTSVLPTLTHIYRRRGVYITHDVHTHSTCLHHTTTTTIAHHHYLHLSPRSPHIHTPLFTQYSRILLRTLKTTV